MPLRTSTIAPYAVSLLTLLLLIGWLGMLALRRRLRSQHAELFEAMGRPTPYRRENRESGQTLNHFVFRSGYRSVDDVVVRRWVRLVQAAYWTFTLVFLTFALLSAILH